MSDIVDEAQAVELLFRAAALRRAAPARERSGREDCIDCGETIAPERRAALPEAERCVDCQRRHERT